MAELFIEISTILLVSGRKMLETAKGRNIKLMEKFILDNFETIVERGKEF